MRRGTVVLTPFPFTDFSGQKVRPALVVSRSDRRGRDVILAFITSRQVPLLSDSDLLVNESQSDFVQTGLKTRSVVRLDKLVTIEASLILGELGELSEALLQAVDDRLRYVLDLGSSRRG
jgi:mRNA-degrading endonuclease toxin of MazEF toxin-antitoxin module